MLYDLQRFNLVGVNVRQAPETTALQEQKIFSMSPPQKWWFDKLQDGQLLPSDEGWQTTVSRRDLHQDYVEALKPSVGRRASQTDLGLLLKKWLPDEYPLGCQRGKQRSWVLPNLAPARAHFERLTRATYEWPAEVDDVDAEVDAQEGR